MLVLQRRAGESIKIGDNIEITVTDIGNKVVKIAIDAPKEVSIIRSELLMAVDINKESVSHDYDLLKLKSLIKNDKDEDK